MPLVWALIGWSLACLFAIGFFVIQRQRRKADTRLNKARIDLAGLAAKMEEHDAVQDALAFEKEKSAKLEQSSAVLETRLQEREKALADLQARLENDFQAIASKMLNTTHQTFLERANETFLKHEAKQKADAQLQQKAVNDLLTPVKETLVRYEEGLREMRNNQQKAQGLLTGQIETLAKSSAQIQAEAAKLSTALKSGSRTRGRWGEEQLRNVVEMTGMSQYADFTEQHSVRDEKDQLKKPDMVINLPGDRKIAIDSKVSLSAYLDAVETTEEAQRTVLLAKHSEEMWTHVQQLSRKDYASALKKDNALDFVVMFIPGENFFAAAMEARPNLFQEAFDRGVLMATPTTLIAILKSIAYGWRQEKASHNAHKVAELASDLYQSMRRMGDGMEGVGKSLEATVKKFNKLVGNMEGSVMPKARKFAEFEMPGTEQALEQLEPVETDIREIRADRDLITNETPPQLDKQKQRPLPLS